MGTLQQIRSERKTFFKQLLAQMKVLDGRQEKLQRFLRIQLSKKKGFIDVKDLNSGRLMFNDLTKEVNTFASIISKGFIE